MAKRQQSLVVISRVPEQVRIEINTMPQFELDRMCRTIISGANRFFENQKVRQDFDKWKAAKERQHKQEVL